MKKSIRVPKFDGLEPHDLLTGLWSPNATRAAIVARLGGGAIVGTGQNGAGEPVIMLGTVPRPGGPTAGGVTVIGTVPDIESDLKAQQLRLGFSSSSTLPPLNKAAGLHAGVPVAFRPVGRPI